MRAPLTTALLLALPVVFWLQLQAPDGLLGDFALWPPGAGFRPWQLLSSALLHAGLLHLAVNAFGLWMFGRAVEARLGSGRMAVLLLVSVCAAAAAQIVVGLQGDPRPTVGASGALFGVLGAYAMLFPRHVIVLLIPPVPLPAPLFVALYAAFELYAGVTGSASGVAHFAHLGGLVGGLVALSALRQTRARQSGH